ncbi:MAG: glycosyltransferase [Bacteroidetes bacterium]|nr:glycosyltransferase [Bacteroidota bacterium]
MTDARRVVMCVTNDLVHDQRIHKMALTLMADGWQPLLIGRLRRQSPPLPARPYRSLRMRLPFERGKFFYISYNIWLFFRLMRVNAEVICANDLDTLPACYAAALWKRTPLVYDSHEYFTGSVELVARPVTRRLWQLAEQVLLPLLPIRITVTESVRQAYERDFPRPAWHLVRNLPQQQSSASCPKAYPPVILYQGMLNEGRGLHWLINALPLLPGWQVWIVGGGILETPLHRQALELGVTDRVHFWGMQPFETLHKFTCQATIGVSIEDNLSPNNRFAAPNKLYDYIHANVPVVVTPLPEHSHIVNQWEVGEVMQDFSAEALAQAVQKLSEPRRYDHCTQQCAAAMQSLCWQPQEPLIQDIYRQALTQGYVV